MSARSLEEDFTKHLLVIGTGSSEFIFINTVSLKDVGHTSLCLKLDTNGEEIREIKMFMPHYLRA